MKKPLPIEVPDLSLRHSSVDEHCKELAKTKKAYFWWYMGMTPVPWNFSLPFQDEPGRWWYQVKPGLCWPVDFLKPVLPGPGMPLSKSFLGFQHIAPEHTANSKLIINMIEDISTFGPEAINDKRRNIRTGFNACSFETLKSPDEKVYGECAELWRDFVGRTAWKKAVDKNYISKTWGCLLDVPGVSIIVGRDRKTGKIAGFLITKIIGDTAYVDTIASSSALMGTRVNDALVYAFIINSQRIAQVKKAHYSLLSYKSSLEKFKQSHGFKPVAFPAFTYIMPPMGILLKRIKADSYNRMMGNMEVPIF